MDLFQQIKEKIKCSFIYCPKYIRIYHINSFNDEILMKLLSY